MRASLVYSTGFALLASTAQAWLDITARNKQLDCGAGGNNLTAGYIDLDDGHMFFTLFEGKGAAKNGGLVVQFGGGPGATSWDYALLGAAPCQLKKGENGTLEPSPFPWTDHANLLLLDYPVGAGWSYNDPDQIPPNSSLTASYDFDTFLQSFLTDFPQYIDQPLIISSVSYGGFLAAYISETVTQRNLEDTSGKRIKKNIDQILLGNPFGDVGAELRWRYNTSCVDQPPVFDQATCDVLQGAYPKSQPLCQDSLLWADQAGTLEARTQAYEDCVNKGVRPGRIANLYNRYEAPCNDVDEPCFWWQLPLMNAMATKEMTSLLNVRNPDRFFWYVNSSALNFFYEHDNMQNNAFKHYSAALNEGTRLYVMSGEADTVCPWRESLSFMKRLPSKYLEQFRATNDSWIPFASSTPATGTVINPGADYTLIRVVNGSHFVSEQFPELVQRIIADGVKGKNYDPTK